VVSSLSLTHAYLPPPPNSAERPGVSSDEPRVCAVLYRGMNPRGAGYVFGSDICAQFCHRNNVKMMARAHQLVMEGFKFMFDEKLVTVWSAPNYCYRCGNVASILEVDENLNNNFKTFEAAPASHRSEPDRGRKLDYFL
jgi:serine/threonine-protein phosphatase 4 catalytic subunit